MVDPTDQEKQAVYLRTLAHAVQQGDVSVSVYDQDGSPYDYTGDGGVDTILSGEHTLTVTFTR